MVYFSESVCICIFSFLSWFIAQRKISVVSRIFLPNLFPSLMPVFQTPNPYPSVERLLALKNTPQENEQMRIAATLLLAIVAACAPDLPLDGPSATAPLTLLPLSDYPLATCLDGSPGGYYHSPAPANASEDHKNTWVVYFQGGAWCLDDTSCYYRSLTHYGTSTNWPRKQDASQIAGGFYSRNCTKNPALCDVNFVRLQYCDGYSYLGAREEPRNVVIRDAAGKTKSVQLFLRGSYIRKAVFDHLLKTTSIGATATSFLLTGGSAGGMAVYLHSWWVKLWVKDNLPRVTKLKAVPACGMFIAEDNVQGVEAWPLRAKGYWNATNAVTDSNPACLQAMRRIGEEEWRCVLPETSFSHATYVNASLRGAVVDLAIPTFVQNSFFDAWQLFCQVLNFVPFDGNLTYDGRGTNESWVETGCGGFPKFAPCISKFLALNRTKNGPCTCPSVWEPLLAHQQRFIWRMTNSPGYNRAGNGAFLSSCYGHGEGVIGDQYAFQIKIGGVSMSDAMINWWNDDRGNDSSSSSSSSSGKTKGHYHIDCLNKMSDDVHFCNPTCPIEA